MKRVQSRTKQKGFTMVELLASIVIMGLLAAVAIGAISFLLDTAEKRYYESLKKTVILAGQSYYADNRSQLPKAIGDSRKVTLKTLIEKKYLEKVVDYGKKDCAASTSSYIKVFKYAKDKYTYSIYLNCPNYKITETKYENQLNVTFTYNYSSKNIENAYYTATITASGGNKIGSYIYSIYQDNKIVYTSENIAGNYVSNITKKINLKKYVPGNIKIGVTVYDMNGNHKLFMSEEKSIYDDTTPNCGTISPKYTTWINNKSGSRKVTVKCVNGESTCLQKEFSQNFTEDTETGYITIKGTNADGSGRGERKCPVDVKIDKTDPVCGTNTGSTTWTKKDREISILCSDETSQCEKNSYSETFTKTTKTSNIAIKDKAGNTASCPVNVYVDKTAPTCGTVTGASTSWTNQNRTISVTCSDADSGCKQSSFSKTFTADGRTGTITIEDNAGNKTDCSVNTYIDKTPPVIKILGFSKLNYAENRNCIGKTTANGNFECNIKIISPGNFGYSTTRDYTDNLSGVNISSDQYIFYSRTAGDYVVGGSTNCTDWFIPNNNTACKEYWFICSGDSCSRFYHAYQKERIYDYAGNVSNELSIHFTTW